MRNEQGFAVEPLLKSHRPAKGRSYVYVIANDGGHCKVGRSRRPRTRLSELRLAQSGRLDLLGAVAVKDADAALIEKRAHDILRPFRVRGEWFKTSAAFAMLAVAFAAGHVADGLFTKVRAFVEFEREPSRDERTDWSQVRERTARLEQEAVVIEAEATGLLFSLDPWHSLYLPKSAAASVRGRVL